MNRDNRRSAAFCTLAFAIPVQPMKVPLEPRAIRVHFQSPKVSMWRMINPSWKTNAAWPWC